MKKAVLLNILFISILSFSQEENKENFLFEKKLERVINSDSITKHIKAIKEILVATSVDSIISNSKWELLYLHKTGWEESLPNNRQYINVLYIDKPKNIVTGQDLKDFFKLIDRKEIILNQFPSEILIEPRGAPLNGKSTIIFLKNNHITLQYIHSYPNGNQSSWFRKTNYYFKKIN
jgi:hypothetical protein